MQAELERSCLQGPENFMGAINNDDVEEDFISNDDRENWSRVGRTSLLIPTWSPS